jgi:hypothetical protein
MKIKTTLAALLLSAVMVTPSYGASDAFLEGCEEYLKKGVVGDFKSGRIDLPQGSKYGQLLQRVAHYVYYHPEYHHESNVSLVRRACKETWPDLKQHSFLSIVFFLNKRL